MKQPDQYLKQISFEAYNGVMYNIAKYILLFLFYTVLGTFLETLFRFVTEHHWYSVSGFLNLPILPIYGFGALLILLITKHIRNPILLFIVSGLAAALLEFATSWLIELIFGVKIWDYSHDPLNFEGRVRLANSIGFALGALLIVYIIQPRIIKLYELIPRRTAIIAAVAGGSVVAVDIIFSVFERLM